jgi:crotonobetainyl-CoA:carnitine CoA-transferase CaiB-like acyl-CoA transferase
MSSDNIFSGLKVVDFASFVAGPGAAVMLSDFGADVIKVEPPSGDGVTTSTTAAQRTTAGMLPSAALTASASR